ncbi:MAG TPA: carbon monoxide dehydrogenase subunit G [Casimicrobiaceae bacterium]|jgi:carbon monoxide dehydrogenase subunit G|nr:carbon monoxide dehydrogenase subunit G [Casimicrobiaceae bacterium]HET9748994.1 carbon monoxide dehydrogenase subunit G [Casimicrobiaceae bacterium]
MELANTRIVPASPSVVWAALNDPATLAACLPGCESFERTGDDSYKVVMAARVGPVSAKFTGNMTMTDVDAPNGYTLRFEGQGGAAGFARGEARVTLAPEGEQHTALTYAAKAQVGGKLAQIGSRLVDGAAAKLVDDFFARFTERLAPAAPGVAGTATTPAGAPAEVVPAAKGVTRLAPPGGAAWIRYAAIVAIAIVIILLYARGTH